MASTGELQDHAASLQSIWRELQPMRWRRGKARFVDPNGRHIAAGSARPSSWLEIVEPEDYDLPAGTADASQVALDLTRLWLAPYGRDAAVAGLRFAARWGLLRSGPGGPIREQWGDMVETASGIAQLLVFKTAIVSGDSEFLEHLRTSDMWNRVRGASGLPLASASDFGEQLSTFIATALTGGMTDCVTQLVALSPGQFALSTRCRTLAARAYYEASALLAWRKPLRGCEAVGCRQLFVVEDPRMKYCTTRCREREKKRRATATAPTAITPKSRGSRS